MAVEETTESVEVENDSAETDADLEDIEVSAEELAGDEEEAEELTEDTDAKDEAEDTEEEESDKETEAEEPEVDEKTAAKALNKEMAEKRIEAKAKREETLKKEQRDYLAEADSEDPVAIAVRQLQVNQYNTMVEGNENKLTNGYERAIKDFDILGSEDPAVQRRLERALDSFSAKHVKFDKYDKPTEVTGDLYQYLQEEAESIAELTGLKVKHQKEDKDKEKSKVLTPPGRPPKTPKKDPMMEAFDEEAWR